MKPVQISELKNRVLRMKVVAERALRSGQKGLYEKVMQQMAVSFREQEADVAGYGRFITKTDVEKYRTKVRGRVVEFCPLEEFPRALPNDVQETLESVKQLKIFDVFSVLHTNLTGERAKPMEKRIREKDPILFGSFSYDKERLFYITDWVDEYCDLTFKEFIDVLQKDSNWTPQEMREPTKEEIQAIFREVSDRHERLQKTNTRNWQSQEQAEKDSYKKEGLKKRWWQFWKT